MANEYKDVIRVEDSTASLPGILRNQQLGMESDSLRRLGYKDSTGAMKYWTPDGGGTGISAYDVEYVNTVYSVTNVGQALDYLLKETLTIQTLTNSTAASHKGQTVDDTTISWGITGIVDGIALENVNLLPGGLETTETSYGYTGLGMGPTGAYSFKLTAQNSWESTDETVYTYFKLNKYYGSSSMSAPNEAYIEAATNSFMADTTASKVLGEVNIACGGQYPFYAYPASWGALTNLYVNGFISGWNITTVAITNAHGNTENYTVYTSPNTIAGSITLSAD